MSYRTRKKVTWKPGEVHRALRPHPLVVSWAEVPPNMTEIMEQHLVVGSLWQTAVDITSVSGYPSDTYKQHELPYVWAAGYQGAGHYNTRLATAGSGTVAVYTGIVRVEEEDRAGRLMQIPRHSFLIGGARYITADLSIFKPCT